MKITQICFFLSTYWFWNVLSYFKTISQLCKGLQEKISIWRKQQCMYLKFSPEYFLFLKSKPKQCCIKFNWGWLCVHHGPAICSLKLFFFVYLKLSIPPRISLEASPPSRSLTFNGNHESGAANSAKRHSCHSTSSQTQSLRGLSKNQQNKQTKQTKPKKNQEKNPTHTT